MHDQYLCSVLEDNSKIADFGCYFHLSVTMFFQVQIFGSFSTGLYLPTRYGTILFIMKDQCCFLSVFGQYLNFCLFLFCYLVILIW